MKACEVKGTNQGLFTTYKTFTYVMLICSNMDFVKFKNHPTGHAECRTYSSDIIATTSANNDKYFCPIITIWGIDQILNVFSKNPLFAYDINPIQANGIFNKAAYNTVSRMVHYIYTY